MSAHPRHGSAAQQARVMGWFGLGLLGLALVGPHCARPSALRAQEAQRVLSALMTALEMYSVPGRHEVGRP